MDLGRDQCMIWALYDCLVYKLGFCYDTSVADVTSDRQDIRMNRIILRAKFNEGFVLFLMHCNRTHFVGSTKLKN